MRQVFAAAHTAIARRLACLNRRAAWQSTARDDRSRRNSRSATPSPSLAAFADMSPEQRHLLLSGNQADALPWVRMAAEHGVPEAQLRLGRMLLEGAGCAPDQPRALAWFTTAARDGDTEAMNMVGRCLENGWGTAPDPSSAAIWFGRAAARGDAWAQYNLGHLLLDGNGVAQDRHAAFAWYQRAADQGHARAMNLVARCLEHGWGTQRDINLAIQWYRRSAEAGYFRGQYNYATLLLAGGHAEAARTWLTRAASGATPAVAARIAKVLHSPELAQSA